jgi:hypothetical protein
MVLQPEIRMLAGKALFAGDDCDFTGVVVVLSVGRTEVMYGVDTTNFEVHQAEYRHSNLEGSKGSEHR